VLDEVKSDVQLRLIPIIILTTSDSERDIHQAYHLHANCYLTKPVEMERFLEVVRGISDFWLTLVRLPSQVSNNS
jgi:CheY-like chemotaxis protein